MVGHGPPRGLRTLVMSLYSVRIGDSAEFAVALVEERAAVD